jgi:hypothetical protein
MTGFEAGRAKIDAAHFGGGQRIPDHGARGINDDGIRPANACAIASRTTLPRSKQSIEAESSDVSSMAWEVAI